MNVIDPTRESLADLQSRVPAGQPVTMVNLLRYRDRAEYPRDADATPCSGREAYQRYGATAVQKIREVGGRVVWSGQARALPIGAPGERWDEVVLVQYPSVEAFLHMIAMPDYRAATVHRSAGLESTRLIATTEPR